MREVPRIADVLRVHIWSPPLSFASTFLCGIGFLIAADVFGFATASLLAFTLRKAQLFAIRQTIGLFVLFVVILKQVVNTA